jgi:hypothetical protein
MKSRPSAALVRQVAAVNTFARPVALIAPRLKVGPQFVSTKTVAVRPRIDARLIERRAPGTGIFTPARADIPLM